MVGRVSLRQSMTQNSRCEHLHSKSQTTSAGCRLPARESGLLQRIKLGRSTWNRLSSQLACTNADGEELGSKTTKIAHTINPNRVRSVGAAETPASQQILGYLHVRVHEMGLQGSPCVGTLSHRHTIWAHGPSGCVIGSQESTSTPLMIS